MNPEIQSLSLASKNHWRGLMIAAAMSATFFFVGLGATTYGLYYAGQLLTSKFYSQQQFADQDSRGSFRAIVE